MKKIIIALLILILTLAGCNAKPKDDVLDVSAVENFRTFISQTTAPFEIKKSLDKRIEKSGIKTADALVIEYLDYMTSLVWEGIPGSEEKIQALSGYLDYDTGKINIDEISDQNLKTFYETFTAAGFKLIQAEGFGVPIIDYHFLEKYDDKVSSEIKDFASLMCLGSDNPWAIDAGIVIPLEDLGRRIALSESYITAYPHSPLTERVTEQYRFYLAGFLRGLDNTPLVNHNTNKVNPDFVAAFEHFILTYPDLVTTETVKGFLQELEAADYAAPYRYSEHEKRMVFMQHVDDLVMGTLERL